MCKSFNGKYLFYGSRFLVKQLTGARTLPANFYTKLNDSLVSRFSIGSVMEVVDKNRISQVKVCINEDYFIKKSLQKL